MVMLRKTDNVWHEYHLTNTLVEVKVGLRKLFPKFYPLLYSNGFTYYSQNSHLLFSMWPLEYGEYYCIGAALKASAVSIFSLGVPCLVNILELNMNGGLQANFLSTGSAKQDKYTVMHVLQGSCKLAEQCGLFITYRSLQYVTFTSCNVVVLRRILVYCNVGWCVKDGVVHCSRQQSLIAKWLGLGVTVTVRVRVRARAREWDYFFFFFFCVKWQRHLCCSPSTLTVRHSRCNDNSMWRNDDVV